MNTRVNFLITKVSAFRSRQLNTHISRICSSFCYFFFLILGVRSKLKWRLIQANATSFFFSSYSACCRYTFPRGLLFDCGILCSFHWFSHSCLWLLPLFPWEGPPHLAMIAFVSSRSLMISFFYIHIFIYREFA